MTDADGRADLHVHTTASDGTVDVATRVDQAVDRGLDVIAVTDHDCFAPSLEAPAEQRNGVTVVSGTEVRADLFDAKIELLAYFVEPASDSLGAVLERARGYRVERNRTLVENLRSETTFDRTYDRLEASADGNLGRPHVAEALVDDGLASSIGDAFDRYLGSDGVAYVPMERVPYRTVIDAVHDAGGVASLAHPGRIRSTRVPEMVDTLARAGLDAIEVAYPYADAPSSDYADVGVEDARALAERHSLVETGGSDCHGPESGKFRLGEVTVSVETVETLRSLATSVGNS